MRNRYTTGLLLILLVSPQIASSADDGDEPASPEQTPADSLAPIDLGDIAPIRLDLEHYDAAALLSPIVCQRVRTIRSWIPREVCMTRAELARHRTDGNRRARVEHDIRTLREIHRFQMRNSRGFGRWR